MAGKNQPPEKGRVIILLPRTKARQVSKRKSQLREQQTRRVRVPRR